MVPILRSSFFLTNAAIFIYDIERFFIGSPTNDLSILMDGNVALDAHRYANAQWGYIVKKQSTAWGKFVDRHVSDSLDVPRVARVTVSEWPESSAAEFPPFYTIKKLRSGRLSRGPSGFKTDPEIDDFFVPVITLGRYGTILKKARPSDDAFVAMFDSAQTIIRCALQDLGPICVPKTKMTVPGTYTVSLFTSWTSEQGKSANVSNFLFVYFAIPPTSFSFVIMTQ